jgi:hypothetical protein
LEVAGLSSTDFTSHLRVLLPEIIEIEERLEQEFLPAPIGLVSLYGETGWLKAVNFHSISNTPALFEVIEVRMVSGDNRMKDVIAIGLIEALITASTRGASLTGGAVVPHLGPHSRA